MKQQLIVGLTGTFGSGKSTVGKILKQLGARRVIDSDRLASEAFRRREIRKRVKSLFGLNGKIDRKIIAREVFSNASKRKRLEAIVHPYVFKRIAVELKNAPAGIVVLEIPLLFESGFDRKCDVTVVVAASGRILIRRLQKRGFNAAQARERFRAQLSVRQKIKRADLCIFNSKSKQRLRTKTKLIWKKLLSRYIQKMKKGA